MLEINVEKNPLNLRSTTANTKIKKYYPKNKIKQNQIKTQI